MRASFAKYLVEQKSTAFFTFARMNPPTEGHGKLLARLVSEAGSNPLRVFLSQSVDETNNPLQWSERVKYVRKMFPKVARSVSTDKSPRDPLGAAVSLFKEGFRNINMVVGSDRAMEFDILLHKYNGKESRHGLYNFESINVISAGIRDPDSAGVDGVSASKQRALAEAGDYSTFSRGVPPMPSQDIKALFNDVRRGMGLEEVSTYIGHIKLPSVSPIREAFVAGDLFQVGDTVIVRSDESVATIHTLGANYVIVEDDHGVRTRKWLDAVEVVPRVNDAKVLPTAPTVVVELAPISSISKYLRERRRRAS